MDKRLPHRIREICDKLRADGRVVASDGVREELCRTFPEYVRVKKVPLQRLIAQQLSSQATSAAGSAEEGAAAASDARESKRRRAGDPGQAQQQPAAVHSDEPAAAQETLNGSLRRMYHQGSDAGDGAPGPRRKASQRGKLARERAAMAAARRDAGLPEPEGGSGFQPEDRPDERLENLGGVDTILTDLRQLIVNPLLHPEVFDHLGVQPPTGVLLHGPPGSGKTKLAHAVAGTTGVTFFKVAATEVVSGMSGESEAKIRQLFQAAIAAAPALIFLDEVDSITPKRDSAGREMERRIVAQLLTCMDELRGTHVVVLGATNRPDSLDPALRRAGRFDREIAMGIPDEAARAHILSKMVSGIRLSGDLDVAVLASQTPGFVGADLQALVQEASLHAVSRCFSSLGAGQDARRESGDANGDDARPRPFTAEELAPLAVDMSDFQAALPKVQPSALREGFATIPEVSWEDVGALDGVRTDLEAAICEPIRKAALFKQLGLATPSGVLLFGPPGCGKTLLAKATANASGANFIAIKGPELLNKYVGESERAVRLVFQRALNSAPCVVFFDELDSLVPRRSAEGSSSAERVVNQMLTEMDGVQQRSQVYVIAATNRPDIIDPAMLRPGRLDRLLFVPLPSVAGRLEILRAHTRKLPLVDVDLPQLAGDTDGFSGADLASLIREAAMIAIRSADVPASEGAATECPAEPAAEASTTTPSPGGVLITAELFAQAQHRVSASVSRNERAEYEDLAKRLCGWNAQKEAT